MSNADQARDAGRHILRRIAISGMFRLGLRVHADSDGSTGPNGSMIPQATEGGTPLEYDAPPRMNRIVVFSGHAHPDLARTLCRRLKVPLSPSTITAFSNDCLGVQLEANCRQADVFIVQPLVPPVQHHLMELLLMLDAARGASAARITAVIPYFAYARSDKKDAPRISIAARLVADLLAVAGASRVLAMTLHSPQVHGFFSVPVDHMNALKVLAQHFGRQQLKNTVVVSPDLGNAKAASHFARSLGLLMAAASKKRLTDDRVVIDTLVGDVAGKNVIVLDDEIANGGTIMEVLNRLREKRVKHIAVACTHGLFTGQAIARLGSQPDIVEIITTDTVPVPPEKRLPNMKILSIAPLLAEAIRRIHFGKSVSVLFDA